MDFIRIIAGVTGTEGVVWKEHRRFLSNVFRELGVGRQPYEHNIYDEMEYFLQVGKFLSLLFS